jgi:hypothetical protein
VLRPHVHEIREILDAPDVGLGLEAVLEGGAGGLERRFEPLLDRVVDLAAEAGLAAPLRARPDAHRGRQLAGVEQRHVAGDEHEVIGAFSGKVDFRISAENATTQKNLERVSAHSQAT